MLQKLTDLEDRNLAEKVIGPNLTKQNSHFYIQHLYIHKVQTPITQIGYQKHENLKKY